jgi:hypothetical protein
MGNVRRTRPYGSHEALSMHGDGLRALPFTDDTVDEPEGALATSCQKEEDERKF